ncbi:MAG TPA: septal ring lytic transglycosylase RlpA family protein [Stellaceae bacterium]|nr:septal ring lytic transglycosylase RlpA family protein [Stellaceae bacterium]
MRRRLQLISCLLMASVASPAAADAATHSKKHAIVTKRAKTKAKAKSRSKTSHGQNHHGPAHHGQRGTISFMHPSLDGNRMADGHRFDMNSNAAASKSLPLGSLAKVTNLRNGKTAVVKVEDRGPHSKTRIMDVSPATAKALGMSRSGVVLAEIEPLPRRRP